MQLFDKKGSSVLNVDVSKAFASGGEGSICEHPIKKAEVIKVYHKPRGTELEKSLLELNKLDDSFVKPKTIYYTQRGEVAGFTMDLIDSSKYVILKKVFNTTYCLQHGYDWNVKLKICENLKRAVELAHYHGIYIGDLNPYNILVDNTGKVLLLDVDSYGTSPKPHNGVLLDDIRDWIQHPKINKTTDLYSYDVLVFWMLTFLHPFRGEYPICKTLEERVCKKPDWLNTHTQLIG